MIASARCSVYTDAELCILNIITIAPSDPNDTTENVYS